MIFASEHLFLWLSNVLIGQCFSELKCKYNTLNYLLLNQHNGDDALKKHHLLLAGSLAEFENNKK